MSKITIYSDGACATSTGKGGWGSIIKYADGKEVRLSGGQRNSTNNQMEMQGVINALESIPSQSDVQIVSDSQYVIKGISEWLEKWKANGWKRKEGEKLKEIKNLELWQKLDELLQNHTIQAVWVKGHNGHSQNEECDRMACAEIEKL